CHQQKLERSCGSLAEGETWFLRVAFLPLMAPVCLKLMMMAAGPRGFMPLGRCHWMEGGVRVSAICSTIFPLLISITPVLPRLSMCQMLSMQVPISQRHCDIFVLASLERRCPEDNVLHFLSYPISEMQPAPGGATCLTQCKGWMMSME
ncbi:hypothetical protein KIL84_015143, partial [Mauremys mutica]